MATLLIQVQDETDPDFYVNAGLPKRGDVLRLHDGGPESFGAYYRNNPAYRLVTVRGTVDRLAALVETEPIPDLDLPSRTRRHREVSVDPDALFDNMTVLAVLRTLARRQRIVDPAKFLVE